MNGGQQAEPLGTQPKGEVEAAGETLWETNFAGSMLRARGDRGNSDFNSGLVQVNVRVCGVLTEQQGRQS